MAIPPLTKRISFLEWQINFLEPCFLMRIVNERLPMFTVGVKGANQQLPKRTLCFYLIIKFGAIAAIFGGASWRRCRTHFMTNLLTRIPRRAQPWVVTMVRTIYQQPSPDEVHAQLDRVTDQLQNRFPQVASLLDEAGPDVLALLQLPTRPLEEDLVQQPTGASQQGYPATHRCRGHLP